MKIFVSYSRRDAGDFANQIQEHLSSFKHDVFTDVNHIHVGDVWSDTIEQNISSCDVFVVIVTHGALNSPQVENEVLQAQRENKTIIPCFFRDINPNKIKLGLEKIKGVEFDDKYELVRDLYVMIDPIDNRSEGRNGTKTYGDLSRRSAQWYLDKAKEWENVDENEKALKQYENAIEEEPENFLVRCDLFFFLERIGKTNEALEAIEQAIDFKPTNTEVWSHKARILEKLGKYEEAIVALTKDLKLDSKDIKSWTSKAKLLEKVGRYNEALEILDADLLRNSIDIEICSIKANILEKLERYKEASKIFQNILIERQKKDNVQRLFQEGNVRKFNDITKDYQKRGTIEHGYLLDDREFTHRIDLSGVQIYNNVNLKGIDLHESDICRTVLNNSDFSNGILYDSNLASARAEHVKFYQADLQNTYMSQIKLKKSDLSYTNLSKSYLLNPNLTDTNLSYANLSNAILVGCENFEGIECQNADFKDAIIDNEEFVDYLRKHKANNVPDAINTKEELELKLQEKGYDKNSRIYSKILEYTLLE